MWRRRRSSDQGGSRAARRIGPARWRDARLWLGIAMLATSTLVGAAAVSGSADTVTVLRSTRDLAVGTALDPAAVPDDLEPIAVERSIASGYLTERDLASAAGRLRWPVPAGQLLPRAAIADTTPADTRRVTIDVEPLHAPVGLQPGDLVDVWVTARDAADSPAAAPVPVIAAVTVMEVASEDLGMSGDVGIVLDVPAAQVGDVVGAARSGVLDVVALPISAQSSGVVMP